MTTEKTSVMFSGVLRGQGQEATCLVSATKNTLPGAGAVAYSNYGIHHLSKALPDGEYELTAKGQKNWLRLKGGFWLSPV